MTKTTVTKEEAAKRLIKRSDYVSCSVAFIDCKKPGSHLKENYSMIGPGVTTSTDQVINLREPHGFASARPRCRTASRTTCTSTSQPKCSLCSRASGNSVGTPMADDGGFWARRATSSRCRPGFFAASPMSGRMADGFSWRWAATIPAGSSGIPASSREAAQYGLYLTKDNILVDTTKGQPKPDDADLINRIGGNRKAAPVLRRRDAPARRDQGRAGMVGNRAAQFLPAGACEPDGARDRVRHQPGSEPRAQDRKSARIFNRVAEAAARSIGLPSGSARNRC